MVDGKLTVKDISAKTGLAGRTVLKAIKEGKVKAKVSGRGGRLLISVESFDKWKERGLPKRKTRRKKGARRVGRPSKENATQSENEIEPGLLTELQKWVDRGVCRMLSKGLDADRKNLRRGLVLLEKIKAAP